MRLIQPSDPRFRFIPAQAHDEAYLLALRLATMVPHLENAGIFLTAKEHLLRLHDHYHCSHLIYCDAECIGTIKFRFNDKVFEIMQLQIHPDFQGRGFGSSILQQVILAAGHKAVNLTVLKCNPAYQLYLRSGFNVIGEDEHEYHLSFQVNKG
ncbi:GNAT family N-acetyltransferase [Pseudoalteromonas tunicata]|jgi:ribosomal protein S18 acetylase RimI-like enzyme|uniref:Acetyltransferase, GNAT family protein n=1 Tax=Pseudoalteromonas tunicata D2 TaxID=87626 RepID=A4CB07_9GAMM|nr:GNAT family N-acetyltransferase [Pseudoalteromonas tunicata]ATC95108.1 hypothetical protein PTUN_a2655 [Pseudoalteromonas tunicata]EAR28565.1 acetyltransferase, GNAT family protein [Pseudoalteromonas tunicata D2]MDP4985755.1 GNAT family N-acetyltransferase [Pseudoalteromonas tunicata]MDP5215000.1 GNAT family N-acetyltransferase [Pseudoalteromonas tunicata]